MFRTYICIFSDKLPSHIDLQTFGLLLILSRFIGLPRYSYQPFIFCSFFPNFHEILISFHQMEKNGLTSLYLD